MFQHDAGVSIERGDVFLRAGRYADVERAVRPRDDHPPLTRSRECLFGIHRIFLIDHRNAEEWKPEVESLVGREFGQQIAACQRSA